jgi:hypothetical protein
MFKPLTQQLNERFGSVAAPAMPLPEIEMPSLPQTIHTETIAPAAPQPESPSNIRSLLLSRLTDINPANPELQRERSLLLGKANDLGTLIDAFLDACAEEQHIALKQRHQANREQGRAQLALCQRLEAEFNAANAAWNEANVAKAKAIDAVRQGEWRRDHLHRFSSDGTIRRADASVSEAKTQAAAAVQGLAAAIVERNAAEDRYLAAKGELNRLATEETRLRRSLDGKPYVDPELGLAIA